MYKKAFTLAEVLITLSIIGVVAAVTVPTLMTNIEHQKTAVFLKKAHTVLNQATKMSTVDNGDYSIWDKDIEHEEFIKQYYAPYMKVVKFCPTHQVCGYKEAAAWKNKTGYYGGFNYLSRLPFITEDGMLFSISIKGDDPNKDNGVTNNEVYDYKSISGSAIIVDINASKGPNRFGADTFMFIRNQDGLIMPMGYGLADSAIKQDCNKNGDGLYCAEYIRRNNWIAPDDYPF